MHRFINFIWRIYFVIFCLYKRLKSHKIKIRSDNVLLVVVGHMGDVIEELSAWQIIINHYKQNGKEVYILSSSNTWNFLNMIIDTTGIHHIEFYNASNNAWSIEITKQLFHKIDAFDYDIIIAHIRNQQSRLIVCSIAANYKYVIIPHIFYVGIKGKLISWICNDKSAFKIVRAAGSPQNIYWEQLFQVLGMPEAKMSIMPIPARGYEKKEIKEYVSITVDSMTSERRWPTEHFIELINWLLANTSYDIYVTGQTINQDSLDKYNKLTTTGRLFNMVGQTCLDDWISLIRGAQFHIGVDSGSIHVAASVGTQAFCLTGFWHGTEFMPYYLTESENTKLPICIYRKDVLPESLKCYGCAAKKMYGYGNSKCLSRCKSGHACLCLSQITPEDVYKTIEKAML